MCRKAAVEVVVGIDIDGEMSGPVAARDLCDAAVFDSIGTLHFVAGKDQLLSIHVVQVAQVDADSFLLRVEPSRQK